MSKQIGTTDLISDEESLFSPVFSRALGTSLNIYPFILAVGNACVCLHYLLYSYQLPSTFGTAFQDFLPL